MDQRELSSSWAFLRVRKTRAKKSSGISPAEVVVVLVILAIFFLLLIMMLPRRREAARLASCRRSLMQIGIGVTLYESSQGCLPTITSLDPGSMSSKGPIQELLEALSIPDLTDLSDVSSPPSPQPGRLLVITPLPGLICPSDTGARTLDGWTAPTSYRATTGDQTTGKNGGFAPGRVLRLNDIEKADGLSFTASFSERRLGTRHVHDPSERNYALVKLPLEGNTCPPLAQAAWRGDAGESWAEASWRSSLYNHSLPPNASPSCVDVGGAAAFMGASSDHREGTNVLLFDGSVRTIVSTIHPRIWQGLATTEGASEGTTGLDNGTEAPSPETDIPASGSGIAPDQRETR
ncbi:MAG: DUF1559 domain-containing protein [Isosphaeraceae bacterium]